jgi:anti-sigma regulatory factor (Ser/Thr protein kinase)
MGSCHVVIQVSESSQVGEARRVATRLAEATGFAETGAGKVGIVVTELANNLLRHAKGGELLVRASDEWACGEQGSNEPGEICLEAIAIDRGPGMEDVGRCMRDGFSTGGTSGTGLGAVRRLSSEFAVHSAPGGTVVFSRVAADAAASPPPDRRGAFEWAALSVAAPRETACGDAWRLASRDGVLSLMIADGLGHGPLAADAAALAAGVFARDPFAPLPSFVNAAHDAMRGSRGGALAAAQIDPAGGAMRYVGVGNIAGSLITPEGSRGLFSHNGTAGVQMRKVQQFEYPWPDNALLVMHSDGLQTRWALDAYPGLSLQHPAVIAAVLYRDFCRGPDDATVVVVRRNTN